MLMVDYSYYTDIYQGHKIAVETWPEYSRNAAAYLDMITLGRAAETLDENLLNACNMAICAMAEENFREEQSNGELISVNNAGYTETYAQTGKTAGEKMKAVASLYLCHTGLLYRGVDNLCSCATKN